MKWLQADSSNHLGENNHHFWFVKTKLAFCIIMCFFWYITFLKLFFIQLSYDSLKKKVILVNDKRHWFMNFWEGYLAPQVDILYSTFSHFGYFILSSSKWVVSFTPPLFFFSYSVCFFVLFKLLPSWLYHDKQYFNVQKNLVHFFPFVII